MNNSAERKKPDPLYPILFLCGMTAQFFLLSRTGPHPSTDYLTVYEPAALAALEWLKSGTAFPQYPGSYLFRSAYILYVAVFQAIFTSVTSARAASVTLQIILFSAVSPCVYYLLKRNLIYKWVAAAAGFGSIFFFDNIQWAAWLLTDHIYKTVFLLSAIFILDAQFDGAVRRSRFFLAAATILLIMIRPDSIVLLAPLYWMTIKSTGTARIKPVTYIVSFAAVAATAYLLRGAVGNAVSVVRGFYERGDIIVGLGYHVPGLTQLDAFDTSMSGDAAYIAWRSVKIFFLRAFHAFNVAPPFWSRAHKIYYAAHMIPLYLLAAAGTIRSVREKNEIFRTLAAMIAGTFILHGLTRIDGALRTMYTPLAILIMLAAYGLDGAAKRFLSTQKE